MIKKEQLTGPAIKIHGIDSPIQIGSITHFEGCGNYTRIYCKGKVDPIVVNQTLKILETKLPDFLRVNKSILVNYRHIVAFDQADARLPLLTLPNHSSVMVSRRRIVDIRSKIDTLHTN